MTKKEVTDAVDQLNKLAELYHSELTFEVDEESQRVLVKIIDGATGELIRQIPAASVVKQAKALQELAGLIFDKKA